jgi:hypothetical protein
MSVKKTQVLNSVIEREFNPSETIQWLRAKPLALVIIKRVK